MKIKKIDSGHIFGNFRLTDYEETKEAVIDNDLPLKDRIELEKKLK